MATILSQPQCVKAVWVLIFLVCTLSSSFQPITEYWSGTSQYPRACSTKATWCFSKPFNQWYHSFQLKFVLQSAKRHWKALGFFDNINLWYYINAWLVVSNQEFYSLSMWHLFMTLHGVLKLWDWMLNLHITLKLESWLKSTETTCPISKWLGSFETYILQYLKVSEGLLVIRLITISRDPGSTGPTRWTGSQEHHYVLLVEKMEICHCNSTHWVTNYILPCCGHLCIIS